MDEIARYNQTRWNALAAADAVFTRPALDLTPEKALARLDPDGRIVFGEVARVLRPGGIYYLPCANPFTFGMNADEWTGSGYPLRIPYQDGHMVDNADPDWVYTRPADRPPLPGPREYRHTLS